MLKASALALTGEQTERNTTLIASLNELREAVEKEIKVWDNNIERLHVIYSNLSLETRCI